MGIKVLIPGKLSKMNPLVTAHGLPSHIEKGGQKVPMAKKNPGWAFPGFPANIGGLQSIATKCLERIVQMALIPEHSVLIISRIVPVQIVKITGFSGFVVRWLFQIQSLQC